MNTLGKMRTLLTVADVALIAAAAYLASQLIQGMMFSPAVDHVSVAAGHTPQAVVRKAGNPAKDAQAIVQRNIFGSRVGNPAGGEPAVSNFSADLPESALPLTLLGTVVNEGGKRSFAVISQTGSREQDIFFTGDVVREGATLASVQRNRVVLLRQGREEVLEMSKDQRARVPARRPVRRTFAGAVNRNSPPDINVRKTGENSYVMDRREVEGVLSDFNKLLTQIRIVPHFKDGKPDGFKVFNIRPNSFFMKLGMVNGDIIKRVNGLDITGPEQALQMYQQLRQESRITLDLERFSKNITLRYEVR